MKCPCRNEEELDILLDYCAGRLQPEGKDAARAALLRQHMAECAECAALGRGQTELWQTLDGLTVPAVSRGFSRGVWNRIEAAAAEPWYRRGLGNLREGAWKPVLPLAVAVMLVVAGFALDHRGGTRATAATVTVAEAEQVQDTLEDLQLLQNLNASAAEVAEPVL